MRKDLITHFMLGAAILSFVLIGCSSGKGGSSAASSQSVTGVAATGTPIVGTVSLQDSSSPALVRTTTSADNGAFTVDVSGLVPPYLLNVDWTDNTGRHKMYAFAEQAGTTNINPFSNVAFAAAVGISDQVALASNLDPAMYHSIASRYEAACDNLRTALGPLFELFQTAKDPVTDTFNADHTGLDALFDNVKIFVSNGMIVVTNKDPYRLIFKGPINNITAGTFYPQNMPNVAVIGGGAGGGAIDGAALYGQYCATCHHPLASSQHLGATSSDILAGISGVSGMRSLSSLTSAQIDAIAAALATTSTTPSSGGGAGGGAIDGAALYGQYCARCHTPLASSEHLGATSSDILAGISGVSGMRSLATLTRAQIDAIAAALATTSTPPSSGGGAGGGAIDGAALYGQYCARCHTPLASSQHLGATSSDILAGISGVSGMRSLATLTGAQIDAIAAALATTSTPPSSGGGAGGGAIDGAALYGQYCARCHTPLASSQHLGATSSDILAGISGVSGMRSLSTLTGAQIDAIAAALATTSPTPPPPLVCGDCHAIPPATGRHDFHVNSEGVSCGTCHGTGYSKTTVNAATHMNGVTNIASTPGWNPTTRSCSNSCHGTHSWGGTASTPPTSTTGTIDGAALYTQYCSGCHGSDKKGTSVSSIQSAISSVSDMRSLSVLTSAQLQAISTGSTVQATTTTSTPATGAIDGAALYQQYCYGCHGPLATSGHRGAAVSDIQTGINTISGMMPLSTLTSEQIQAISDALNSTTSTSTTTTTPPPLVCGSCHTIPPSSGHHSTHRSRSCGTCHGTGYSTTTVNADTHNNGVKNIASGSTPGWNPSTRSCSNSCHGTHTW